MKRTNAGCGLMLAGLTLALLTGCRVSRNHGDGKDVSIDTPLGGLQVKTDPATTLAKIGLPAYPGAHATTKEENGDKSANVNLSFGSFRLQVLTTALETPDSPAQVEAFYRKALTQYSDVIACRGNQPVGTPARTGMGLTCDDSKHGKTHTGDDNNDLQLKAGSRERQHIVALRREGDGTHVELISLELPHGSNDD